jgi:hypothetical protein
MSRYSLTIVFWATNEIIYDRISFEKETPVVEGEDS